MRLIYLSSFLYLLLAAFPALAQEPFAPQQKHLEKTFKINPEGDSLQLDVFYPDSLLAVQKAPVIVVIHGGGWVDGNRSLETIPYMVEFRRRFNANGFIVASIDYTLPSKNVHFPSPIVDCKDAVRWLRANSAQLGIDSENIGLWGGSAGGHLALLAAYTDDDVWKGEPGLASYSAKVDYVIDNFGPTDLNALFRPNVGLFSKLLAKIFMPELLGIREKLMFALTGHSLKTEKPQLMESLSLYSPINYVSSRPVRTLIIHGSADNVVPIRQSKNLAELLQKNNIPFKFITVKKGDHGLNNISDQEMVLLIKQTIAFVTQSDLSLVK